VRSRLVGQRTALVNQIRGLLAEYGLILPQQISHVRRGLPSLLEDTENGLTALVRELGRELYAELVQVEKRIECLEGQLPRSTPLPLAIDSSGFKVYGEGKWRVRLHGWRTWRTWRKLHLTVDEATGGIVAAVASEAGVANDNALPDLLRACRARTAA